MRSATRLMPLGVGDGGAAVLLHDECHDGALPPSDDPERADAAGSRVRRRVSDAPQGIGRATRPGQVIPRSGPAARGGVVRGPPGRHAWQGPHASFPGRQNGPVHAHLRPAGPPAKPVRSPVRRADAWPVRSRSPCPRSSSPAPPTDRPAGPAHLDTGAGPGGRGARRAGGAGGRRAGSAPRRQLHAARPGVPGPDDPGDQRERRELAGRRAGRRARRDRRRLVRRHRRRAVPVRPAVRRPARAGDLRTPRRPGRGRAPPARPPGAAPVHRLAGRADRPPGPARRLPRRAAARRVRRLLLGGDHLGVASTRRWTWGSTATTPTARPRRCAPRSAR